MAGDHGDRFAFETPSDCRRIAGGEVRGRRLPAVGEQPRPVPSEDVPGEDLGIERRVLSAEAAVDERVAAAGDARRNRIEAGRASGRAEGFHGVSGSWTVAAAGVVRRFVGVSRGFQLLGLVVATA